MRQQYWGDMWSIPHLQARFEPEAMSEVVNHLIDERLHIGNELKDMFTSEIVASWVE